MSPSIRRSSSPREIGQRRRAPSRRDSRVADTTAFEMAPPRQALAMSVALDSTI